MHVSMKTSTRDALTIVTVYIWNKGVTGWHGTWLLAFYADVILQASSHAELHVQLNGLAWLVRIMASTM